MRIHGKIFEVKSLLLILLTGSIFQNVLNYLVGLRKAEFLNIQDKTGMTVIFFFSEIFNLLDWNRTQKCLLMYLLISSCTFSPFLGPSASNIALNLILIRLCSKPARRDVLRRPRSWFRAALIRTTLAFFFLLIKMCFLELFYSLLSPIHCETLFMYVSCRSITTTGGTTPLKRAAQVMGAERAQELESTFKCLLLVILIWCP